MKEYKHYLKNMFQFNGRSRRREYWVTSFINVIISILLNIILFLACTIAKDPLIYTAETGYGGGFSTVETILAIPIVLWSLFMFISTLGLTVRRFHDAGVPGWVYPICLVGIFCCGLGAIALLVIALLPSKEDNPYGVNPKSPENNQYEGGTSIIVSIVLWFVAFIILIVMMVVNVYVCGLKYSDTAVLSDFTDAIDQFELEEYDTEEEYDMEEYDTQEDMESFTVAEDTEDPAEEIDLSADAEEPTGEGLYKGREEIPADADDILDYDYARVWYGENYLCIKPNGTLDDDTVIYDGKTAGELCDYIDDYVLEDGRTINRRFFYDLLAANAVEKDSFRSHQARVGYIVGCLAIANEFYDWDITIKYREVPSDDPYITFYTMSGENVEDDVWIFDERKGITYINNGKTSYTSDMFDTNALSVWAGAVVEVFGIGDE